jgi:ABC-type nitrate/sulfonate/bicarbonate transport system substrate-binding protein
MITGQKILFSFVVFVFFLLSSQAGYAQVDKAIIGYPSRSYNVLVLHVAEVKGFFRDERIDPVIVQMGAGPGILAQSSGDIHYYWNFSGPVTAIMKGMPLKIIAIINRLLHQVVARPEIRNAADLRGKKFGVSRIEGADHLQAKAILRTKGLDPKEIQYINLGGGDPARVLALKGGLVDAVAVSPPNPYSLQKEGYFVVGGPRDLKIAFLASAISATDQRLKEKPDQAKKVLKALMRGLLFVRQNRQETIGIMMRWLNESREIASASYDLMLPELSRDGTFSDAEIQFSVDEIRTAIGMNKPVSLSQVRDFTILQQAQRELGLR